MRRSSVVLPAPEPPMMHDGLLAARDQVDPAEDLLLVEALLHVAEHDDVVEPTPAAPARALRPQRGPPATG